MASIALLTSSASAATITVTGTADDLEVGSPCTLREAVQVSNNNDTTGNLGCPNDLGGPDTILLTAGQTYALTRGNPPEDDNVYGDLDIKRQVTITTTGGLATIDGNAKAPGVELANRDRVIETIQGAGAVTLERLRIQNGQDHSPGGEGGGGGIKNDGSIALTLIDSEVVDNLIAETDPAQNTWGGGIYGYAGTVTLIRSTVANNKLEDNGEESVDGGGIMLYFGDLNATNSTISGNLAEENVGTNADALGGGIYTHLGDVTLTNVTVTGNTASGSHAGAGDGGGIYRSAGRVTIAGSIIADNLASFPGNDCYGSQNSGFGTLISNGGNLVGSCTLSGGSNDLTGVSANLGPLAANGGLTRTNALLPGSLAIDHGGSCPTTDQRGFFRAPVAPCDTGAFELNAPATLPPPPPPLTPTIVAPGPTGQQAAALEKCKKKKTKKKRKKCRKRARLLPV